MQTKQPNTESHERALQVVADIRASSFRVAARKYNLGYATWRAIKAGTVQSYLPRQPGDRVSPEAVEAILASVKRMPQLNTVARSKALGFRTVRVQKVLKAASLGRLAARLEFAGYSIAPSNSLATARKHRIVAAAPGCYTGCDFKYFGLLRGQPGTPPRRICGFVVVDQLTGYGDVLLCPTETADMAAAGIRRYVARAPFPITGLLLHDNGSHFTADVFIKAVAALKLVQRTTRYHHPWSNGKTERLNGTLMSECFPAILTGIVGDIFALQDLVDTWLDYYNRKRQHTGWINRGLPPVACAEQFAKATGKTPLERLVSMGVLKQEDIEFVRPMGANYLGTPGRSRGRHLVYSETRVPYAYILDREARQKAAELRETTRAATEAAQTLTAVSNVQLAMKRRQGKALPETVLPLKRRVEQPADSDSGKH